MHTEVPDLARETFGRNYMLKKYIGVILTITLTSGCATVIKGTNDDVSINSLEDGTVIYVNGA
ncbi:hypothetical protein, partial [Marinobacter nauticus]|uniref:hypothetical protein n=1 Tax=Marinobacter nauticus TaxID=2743 RepID=UPI00242038D2